MFTDVIRLRLQGDFSRSVHYVSETGRRKKTEPRAVILTKA